MTSTVTSLAGDASFDVYGYRFSVHSELEGPLDGLVQDFSRFRCETNTTGVRIELIDAAPPPDLLHATTAVAYTPRNVAYRHDGRRYVDYHGRGLGVRDEQTGDYRLYSRDPGLLYEAAYLYLLSQIGEALDRQGLHRIHALGIVVKGRAVLVLLPMGGGKSTLGLHLLQHPDVQLLSDDSPFIDRQGRVLAYPLRLGLLPGTEGGIPAEHRRMIDRMEFGPKHLVNYSYFASRVAAAAEPGLVLIGARALTDDCLVEPVSRLAALRACVANCVVGVGLFQGLEFVLNSTPWDLLGHAGIGASRLRNCVKLIRRSTVCRVRLGRDSALNARVVLEHARRL